MAGLIFKVDKKAVEHALLKTPEQVINSMNRSLTESAVFASNMFKRNITDNHSIDTGLLRASVSFKFLNRLRVDIAPRQSYAQFVEYGTKPHRVSPKHLEGWAHRHGISPYAVANSIAKKGTKARPFLDKTFEQVQPYALHNMQKHIEKTIQEVL